MPGSCVIKHERAGVSEAPYLSKVDMLEVLKADGIEPPRLYAMGFAHNNCGGFCCRAGRRKNRLICQKQKSICTFAINVPVSRRIGMALIWE